MIEKEEFKEEKISIDEITEKNEYIYDSFRKEYLNLLNEDEREKQKKFNDTKENKSEDNIDVSSFINQDDIVYESHESMNESENPKDENLLINLQSIEEINDYKNKNTGHKLDISK